MPMISGQRLWNRAHLTLTSGENIIPHRLAQVNRNIDPQFAPSVQIIPLPPLANWVGVELGAQPDDENVVLISPDDREVDVLFWEPHTVVGPGDADDYMISGPPPPPPEPVDVCGYGDCAPRTVRVAQRVAGSGRWLQLLARFAPLLAARVSSPL